jgi:hypothetical protein
LSHSDPILHPMRRRADAVARYARGHAT